MDPLASILTAQVIEGVESAMKRDPHKRLSTYIGIVQRAYGIDTLVETSDSVIKRIHMARADGMPSAGEISDYLVSVGAR